MRHFSLLLAAFLCSCGSQKKAPTTPAASQAVQATGGSGDATVTAPAPVQQETQAEPVPKLTFGPVYFAFDDALLTEEARLELQRAGDVLLAQPDLRVRVTGHADERGTEEYNVALGDERARVCREYLGRLGVDGERITALSFGEARPAVPGSNEDAWARNRRVELELSR